MAVYTYGYRMPLPDAMGDMSFTRSLLLANPNTRHLATKISAAMATCQRALTEEVQLETVLLEAEALSQHWSHELDDGIRAVNNAAKKFVNDDTSRPEYAVFFKKTLPHELRAKSLAKKISAMKDWLPSLENSSDDGLQSLHPMIRDHILAAETALAEEQAAENALRIFRTTGLKKEAIDVANAARAEVAGELHKMPFDPSGGHLSRPYERRFFRPRRTKKKVKPSEEMVKLEKEIAVRSKRLSQLQDDAANEMEAEATEKAARLSAQLAEKRRERDRIDAEIEDILKDAS